MSITQPPRPSHLVYHQYTQQLNTFVPPLPIPQDQRNDDKKRQDTCMHTYNDIHPHLTSLYRSLITPNPL
jgi:hypothetical protein